MLQGPFKQQNILKKNSLELFRNIPSFKYM